MGRFEQGYACAVACIIAGHGEGTETEEALEACGLDSMAALKKAGIDTYDLEILTPLVRKIERKDAARRRKRDKSGDCL